MKTNLLIAVFAGLWLAGVCRGAMPLTESTYTEIIREANTLDTGGAAMPAKVNDQLKAPNRVRTGPQSRVELTAPDQSITRVGANTVFSFSDSGRTLNLDEGSLLFHAPKGVGGGVIKSGGASAAVLGTTLIASATTNGGFRVIVLEGKARIKLANGKTVTIKAGQEVYVEPGGKGLFTVREVNLAKLVAGSQLVNGFSHELTSMSLVKSAIDQQQHDLASGKATDTGTDTYTGTGTGTYPSSGTSWNPHTYSPVVWTPGLATIAVPQPDAVQQVTTTTTTFVNGPTIPSITLFGQIGPGPSVPLYNGPASAYPGPTTLGAPPYFGPANAYVIGSAGTSGTAQATAPDGSLSPLTINNPASAPAGAPFPNLEIAYPLTTRTPVTTTTTTYPSAPPRGFVILP